MALLLTIDEAANRLGIGRAKFYSLVKEGRISVVKIGRASRVVAKELDEFVAQLIKDGSSKGG